MAATVALHGLTVACIDRNNVYRIAPIHGHVIDAMTKKPIPGMTISQWFERQSGLGPGGGEDSRVEHSLVTMTTDAGGRFEFPGWRGCLRGIDRLEWWAYKPGYMPAKGWYRRIGDDPRRPDNATIPWPDPWVQVNFLKVSEGLLMDVTVYPPTLNGVTFQAFDGGLAKWRPYTPAPGKIDPWAEYFHRLNVGTRDSLLPVGEFVKETLGYLEKHKVTEAMLPPLAQLTDQINSHQEPDIAQARCTILHGIVRYCQDTPQSEWCALPAISLSIRDFKEDCTIPRESR